MENPRCMDDVPITTSFISIHRRFRIAMFDDQPQSVIDNTTSKPAIGHLSVPPLSQPCRCSLSSACACAAQGWLCFNSWRKWDMLKHWGSSLGHFHSFFHMAKRWNYKSKWLATRRTVLKQTYVAIWSSKRSTPQEVASGSVQTALHLQRLEAANNNRLVTAKIWHQIYSCI